MGRPAVSEYAMRQALNEILAAGEEPSINKIKALVGGSNVSIGAFLRKIRDESGEMFGSGKIVDQELSQVVNSLHDRLKAMTDRSLAAGQLEAQKVVDLAKEELRSEQLKHAETTRLLEEVRASLDVATQTNARVVEQLNSANAQIAKDAEQITSLQAVVSNQSVEIDRLHKEGDLRQVSYEALVSSTVRAREMAQEASARERQNLVDKHSQALADMHRELEKLNDERTVLTSANGMLARDNERLANEVVSYGKELRGAQNNQRDLQAKADHAAREASEVRIAAAVAESQVKELRLQVAGINAKNDAAIGELQSANSKVEALTKEVARQQAEIDRLGMPVDKP